MSVPLSFPRTPLLPSSSNSNATSFLRLVRPSRDSAYPSIREKGRALAALTSTGRRRSLHMPRTTQEQRRVLFDVTQNVTYHPRADPHCRQHDIGYPSPTHDGHGQLQYSQYHGQLPAVALTILHLCAATTSCIIQGTNTTVGEPDTSICRAASKEPSNTRRVRAWTRLLSISRVKLILKLP